MTFQRVKRFVNCFFEPAWVSPVVRSGALSLLLCAGHAAHAATAFLEGSAVYQTRMLPPPGAVLVVTLEDTSRADAPARELAAVRLAIHSGPPYGWRLAYDPAVVARQTLSLRARIEVDGALWMTTDTHTVALGLAASDKPELVLSGVAAPSKEAANCAAPTTQAAMNACAQMSFEAATTPYAAVYVALARSFTVRQQASLRKTQQAWLAYRTAACNLESIGLEGGSARPMVNLQCATRMTKVRTAELVKLATCPEGDLSCPGARR